MGASCDRHGQPSTWLTADKREFLTKIPAIQEEALARVSVSGRRRPVSGCERGKENSFLFLKPYLTDGARNFLHEHILFSIFFSFLLLESFSIIFARYVNRRYNTKLFACDSYNQKHISCEIKILRLNICEGIFVWFFFSFRKIRHRENVHLWNDLHEFRKHDVALPTSLSYMILKDIADRFARVFSVKIDLNNLCILRAILLMTKHFSLRNRDI